MLKFLRKVILLTVRVVFAATTIFCGIWIVFEFQQLGSTERRIENRRKELNLNHSGAKRFLSFDSQEDERKKDWILGSDELQQMERRLAPLQYEPTDDEITYLLALRKKEAKQRLDQTLCNVGAGVLFSGLSAIPAFGLKAFLNWFARWNP
jgi:hypothetical protein